MDNLKKIKELDSQLIIDIARESVFFEEMSVDGSQSSSEIIIFIHKEIERNKARIEGNKEIIEEAQSHNKILEGLLKRLSETNP